LVDHKHPKARLGLRAGRINVLGRKQIGIGRKQYFVHRLVWLFETGMWPSHPIDHIDRDPLNNRFSNLRATTSELNGQNRGCVDAKGRLIGAIWHKHKRKFMSQIVVGGRTRFLGYFSTAEEAHTAYVEAKRNFHPSGTL
jgi:hypothetical protein